MKYLLTYCLSLLLYISIFSSVVYAQSDVYRCTDEKGRVTYTNTGSTKTCKLFSVPPINGVSAPAPVKKAGTKTNTAASTPANFPKVDNETQRSRDSDRKQILVDEQKAEEQKLLSLKKEYNNGEPVRRSDEFQAYKYIERVNTLKADIERTEKNMQALKREIDNLK